MTLHTFSICAFFEKLGATVCVACFICSHKVSIFAEDTLIGCSSSTGLAGLMAGLASISDWFFEGARGTTKQAASIRLNESSKSAFGTLSRVWTRAVKTGRVAHLARIAALVIVKPLQTIQNTGRVFSQVSVVEAFSAVVEAVCRAIPA